MSNTITVPVVDYKMDKMKAIVIGAVIVLALIIILNPNFLSNLISGIIKGVGNIFSGVANGIGKGIYAASGQQAIDAANDSITQRIDKFWVGSTWIAWMTPDVYNANPSDASIDEATATNLFNNVQSATGTKVLGVEIHAGDMSGIQADFAAVVGNKTDISFVSYIAQKQTGQSLGDIFGLTVNFFNDTIGASGKSNVQMLAEFLEWANSLPQN